MKKEEFKKLLQELYENCEDKTITTFEMRKFFLDFIFATRKKETYDFHRNNLDQLFKYFKLEEILNTNQIDNVFMIGYINWEKVKENANSTINHRIKSLRLALDYCVENDFISVNKIKNIKLLKENQKEIEIIPKVVIEKIFNYLESLPINAVNLRNKIIIYLLYSTGVRAKELANIKIDNINFKKGYIKLEVTKTGKERTVFINEQVKHQILEYINFLKHYNGFLIINTFTRLQMKQQSFEKILNEIKKALDLNIQINPHKWRHTYATMYLEAGASLTFVNKTLGHCDFKITKRYEHVSKDSLKEEHTNFDIFKNKKKKKNSS